MSALCREFGISRKTGDKWAGRYFELGTAGLADRCAGLMRVLPRSTRQRRTRW